ncbi:MAG TPA: hypothetical protein VK427_12305, partial [Kofleriaceae bacterium]|nr:hypothetical protein [Kofleriaceae bacterium]
EGPVDTGLPSPPLPGLPPVPANVVTAPGPRPRLRSQKINKMFDDSEALELEAEDLIDTLDADDAAPAEAAPIAKAAPTIVHTPVPRAKSSTLPPSVAILSADVALRELAAAADRNRIVDVLLGYLAATFEASVVFTVRDNMAFGWKAVGNVPGHVNVEHVLIPLDAPSVVQAAIAAETHLVHGPLAPSTVNSYFFKVIGCAEPTTVTAGAIMIGKRPVNVIYGHGQQLTPLQLEVVQQVCNSAAEAYARLIASSKRKR